MDDILSENFCNSKKLIQMKPKEGEDARPVPSGKPSVPGPVANSHGVLWTTEMKHHQATQNSSSPSRTKFGAMGGTFLLWSNQVCISKWSTGWSSLHFQVKLPKLPWSPLDNWQEASSKPPRTSVPQAEPNLEHSSHRMMWCALPTCPSSQHGPGNVGKLFDPWQKGCVVVVVVVATFQQNMIAPETARPVQHPAAKVSCRHTGTNFQQNTGTKFPAERMLCSAGNCVLVELFCWKLPAAKVSPLLEIGSWCLSIKTLHLLQTTLTFFCHKLPAVIDAATG
jgi:hypothetical protein